jgi:hypothetical protein
MGDAARDSAWDSMLFEVGFKVFLMVAYRLIR